MTITGKLSKQQRSNNQGSYYQLTTEGGTELAVSMTESTTPAEDAAVLDPLLGKQVEADGIIQKNVGMLRAFHVKAL